MALDNFRKVNITLNKANQRVLETQIAKVGDANGRELVVQITNNGVIEDQTGTTLKLNWQHENGNQGSTSFNVIDIKTGKFSVYYPKEMLYKGKVNASIEITSNGQITNSMNFKIIVQADVFNGEAGTVDGVFISLADVNKKLDDREKEYVELKERQTTVENQFNSIQQELTYTDVISAPEIIAARGGEPTLSERLDKEHQNVTAQLAQIMEEPSLFLHEPKTSIIAHRGAHINAPENTIKAIEKAGLLGYDLVELDVQRTSDGYYMLMHDLTVDRTTNGTGSFASLTFAQVNQLIVDEAYLGKVAEEVIKVPTFEEACQECQKWGIGMNVDCSKMTWGEEDFRYISSMLKKYNLWNNSFFATNNSTERAILANIHNDANMTWLSLARHADGNIIECQKYKNAFVTHSLTEINDDLIERYKDLNIPIFVYLCNTWEDVYKQFSKGIRFVETDTVLPGGAF